MASAVDSRLAYARLSAVATASRLPTATRGSNNSYTTSWDTTPVTGLTAENTDQVVVKVWNGTLLMFPSWLMHSVDANRSDKTRISISFNVMFSEYAENMSQPLW